MRKPFIYQIILLVTLSLVIPLQLLAQGEWQDNCRPIYHHFQSEEFQAILEQPFEFSNSEKEVFNSIYNSN